MAEQDDDMTRGPDDAPAKKPGLKGLAGRLTPRRRKAPAADAAASDVSVDEMPAPKASRFAFGKKAKALPETDGDSDISEKPKTSRFSFGKKGAAAQPIIDMNAPLVGGPVFEMDLVDDGAIKIGKNTYAINLIWRGELDDIGLKSQAGSLEVETQMEEIAFHVDLPVASLIGFGAKDIGHASGMKALVTSTKAAVMGDRWIGAFRLGEGSNQWWIGSMRDGEVFHDRVYPSEDDARSAFYNDVSAPGWTRVICPGDWNIPDAVPADLSAVLDPGAGRALKHIYPIKARLPMIIAVVLIAVVGIGGWAYMNKQAAQDMMRQAEAERAARNDKTIDPTTLPWFMAPTVTDFTRDCIEAINGAITIVTGWETQPLSCVINKGDGLVVASWVRLDSGRIEWLQQAQPKADMQVALEDGGNQASLSVVFAGKPNAKSLDVQPWAPQEIERIVRQRFQNLGLPLTMTMNAGATPTNNPNTTASIGSHAIQIRTVAALEEWVSLLSDIPAFVPEVLIYTVSTGEWNLVGRAYHPPANPVRPL